MKWSVKKKGYLFVFIWANLCYLCGQILQQFFSVTGSANAIEGSAESQLLTALDHLTLLGALTQHNVIVVLVVLGITALISWSIVRKFAQRMLSGKWYVLIYIWTYAVLFVSYDQFDSFYKNYGFEGVNLSFFNKMLFFSYLYGREDFCCD